MLNFGEKWHDEEALFKAFFYCLITNICLLTSAVLFRNRPKLESVFFIYLTSTQMKQWIFAYIDVEISML